MFIVLLYSPATYVFSILLAMISSIPQFRLCRSNCGNVINATRACGPFSVARVIGDRLHGTTSAALAQRDEFLCKYEYNGVTNFRRYL